MCFVQTPYYHLCGHYGRPAPAPHGRCARAERTQGACWEPQDIGIRTLETICTNCERVLKISETHQLDTSNFGPVDCHKFNRLVKLYKQTCDRRASQASNSSPVTPTADDLALRRPSTDSEISITSTAASTLSTEGRPPTLTIDSPLPVIRNPTWTSIEKWTRQTIHDDDP
ncbi:hypothetical protein E4T50_01341 [Aureobasidium sp. EXF-12298]|nr:hypothetical protein E4T50_01341 [Aureobasidium sp. EXF-12298]KAI4766091.1 hypothetical protein E4T51_00905 [Aureobasidium sp. EXF-12344]KAI4783665.1 hypothetical protein E4T52_01439 [Aureobasidium sp. EXF-3400]